MSAAAPQPVWSRQNGPVLICDLDGTLIDSLPDLAAAVGELLAGEGRPPLAPEAIGAMVGDGVAKLIERALAATGGAPAPDELAALVRRYLPIYEARMTELTRPYPGAIEALRALKGAGWRLAVCTNKPERLSRAILAALGFEGLIEALAGGDSFPVKKPDPGHPLGLLARMHAQPGSAVMLGDGQNDVLAARRANLPVIAIAHGYGAVPALDLGADLVIETFSELPGALAALGRTLA
ncbi:MAG: HAD family hydrolase [Kiloniellales bacterium]